MATMKRRLPNLARWLAGIYLIWSLFIFFSTLGSEAHSWWPIWLYFIIWPLSALYEVVSSVCLEWLIADPKTAASWMWTLNDYVAGTFYTLVGTIWIWCLG